METSSHFCEGFHFPTNSNSALTLRIRNHDWVIIKKIGQSSSIDGYHYVQTLSIELKRPVCTESVDVLLIVYCRSHSSSSAWEKHKKSVTFPINQKKIEIAVCNLRLSNIQISHLIGVISVSFLDSCPKILSSQLSKDLANLLDSDDSSDYILRCAGQEFHVHKCILAARSSVFAAWFRFHNKNKESQASMTKAETKSNRKRKKVQDCIPETSTASNQVEGSGDIVDMKPEILRKMLKYIYSDQIDDLTSIDAGDLLYAADKYQLELLKKICVQKLKSTLSASNVLDTLVLGDLHDQSLKAHAMDFICKYPSLSELKKMDQWKLLQITNPTMVIEVLTSVVGYLQDSKTQN